MGLVALFAPLSLEAAHSRVGYSDTMRNTRSWRRELGRVYASSPSQSRLRGRGSNDLSLLMLIFFVARDESHWTPDVDGLRKCGERHWERERDGG